MSASTVEWKEGQRPGGGGGGGGGSGGGAAQQRLKRGLEAIDRPERHPVFLQARWLGLGSAIPSSCRLSTNISLHLRYISLHLPISCCRRC